VPHSGGVAYRWLPAEMDAVNYVSRIRMPVLMMNGRHDYVSPYQTSQEPLFALLGTPARDKRHVILRRGSRSASAKPAGPRDSEPARSLSGRSGGSVAESIN
jgi:pimeloyl-ACP methyl ester carboxylesterase